MRETLNFKREGRGGESRGVDGGDRTGRGGLTGNSDLQGTPGASLGLSKSHLLSSGTEGSQAETPKSGVPSGKKPGLEFRWLQEL